MATTSQQPHLSPSELVLGGPVGPAVPDPCPMARAVSWGATPRHLGLGCRTAAGKAAEVCLLLAAHYGADGEPCREGRALPRVGVGEQVWEECSQLGASSLNWRQGFPFTIHAPPPSSPPVQHPFLYPPAHSSIHCKPTWRVSSCMFPNASTYPFTRPPVASPTHPFLNPPRPDATPAPANSLSTRRPTAPPPPTARLPAHTHCALSSTPTRSPACLPPA